MKYVSQLLSNHKVEYNRIQTALKNAALERQVKSTQRMVQDRKLLLGNGQQASERRQRITTEAQLVETAEGTTESLRRTRQMIAEVSFSFFSSFSLYTTFYDCFFAIYRKLSTPVPHWQ